MRFYGHSPILARAGLPRGVRASRCTSTAPRPRQAVQKVREWIGALRVGRVALQGLDHTVTRHRMPGGAFPSSFEQAEKGELPAPDARHPAGDVALQPHRALLRRHPRLADHLGHLQRASSTATPRSGATPACAHLIRLLTHVRRGAGPGLRGHDRRGRAGGAARALPRRPRGLQEPAARRLRAAAGGLAGRLGLPERLRRRVGGARSPGARELSPAGDRCRTRTSAAAPDACAEAARPRRRPRRSSSSG